MEWLRRLLWPRPATEPPAIAAAPIEPLREDPPFTYRTGDPPGTNHVTNDVYARTKNGERWHRVYRVAYGHLRSGNARLHRYGRSFAFVSGHAGSEFEPDENWVFHPLDMVVGLPPLDAICRACRASDAKYGKGDIPNVFRWDR